MANPTYAFRSTPDLGQGVTGAGTGMDPDVGGHFDPVDPRLLRRWTISSNRRPARSRHSGMFIPAGSHVTNDPG